MRVFFFSIQDRCAQWIMIWREPWMVTAKRLERCNWSIGKGNWMTADNLKNSIPCWNLHSTGKSVLQEYFCILESEIFLPNLLRVHSIIIMVLTLFTLMSFIPCPLWSSRWFSYFELVKANHPKANKKDIVTVLFLVPEENIYSWTVQFSLSFNTGVVMKKICTESFSLLWSWFQKDLWFLSCNFLSASRIHGNLYSLWQS